MKKHYILFIACCFAALSAWAADVSFTENYSGIVTEHGGDINTAATASGLVVTGDICKWRLTNIRWAGANDKITVGDKNISCMFLQYDATNTGKIETTNWEGGIKHVTFRWAQFGSEGNNTLKLKVQAGDVIHNPAVTRDGSGGANKASGGEVYNHDFASKSNGQLLIENVSVKGGDNACRILVGDITITPYLLFADKSNQIMRVGDTYTRTITDNTTGEAGALSYSSSNTSVATVDANGEVTAVARGEATITAKYEWNENEYVTTSYDVQVFPVNCETFDGITQTANYSNTTPCVGDKATWSTSLGGFNVGDCSALTINLARFRAPYDNSSNVAYIESSAISGGIASMTFDWNLGGSETTTTWDIRVLINGREVKRLSNTEITATTAMDHFEQISINDINEDGDFVIRFENRSTIEGTYTSGNKGRFLIDNIEWESYEAPKYAVTFGTPEHGMLNVYNVTGSAYLTSGNTVKAGTVLRIEPTPGTGYEVDEVTVNGTPIEAVAGVYSYTMGEADITVSATFSAPDDPTGVDEVETSANAVKVLKNGMLIIEKNGVLYNVLGIKL